MGRTKVVGYKGLLLAIFGGYLCDILPIGEKDYERIDDVLKTLGNQQEEDVLRLRFGLNCGGKTLKQVGEKYSLSQERIRQIEAKALRKLRHPIRADRLRYYFRSQIEDCFIKINKRLSAIDDSIGEIMARLSSIESKQPLSMPIPTGLNVPVESLKLSARALNCLVNAHITTLADLVVRTETELLRTRNLGRKTIFEIKEFLSGRGLSLGMKFY